MQTAPNLNALTKRIIGCAFAVSSALRPGFSEKVFERSMAIALEEAGSFVERQVPITVRFRGRIVGEYVADMLVEQRGLVELKAVRALDESHVAQCLNYLSATGIGLCPLLNFGTPRLGIRRVML